MRHRNKLAGAAARATFGVAAALLVMGCDDYLERRDTLTLGVGDAIAVNKATQTIDRWPNEARQDRWTSDGERARIAIERYRTRSVPNPLKQQSEDGGAKPTSMTPTTP